MRKKMSIPFVCLVLFGFISPFLFPNYISQITLLWMMILFATTWDILGGQMGYNSLGNITFFGIGMYVSAIFQINLFADVGAYTSAFGGDNSTFTNTQYFQGIFGGLALAAIFCAGAAALLGRMFFGLRGPYFAIGTLGLALAVSEVIATWDWVGGGSGISMPVFPFEADQKSQMFYWLTFTLAISAFVFLRWLYSTRFGLAINSIRDDEDKAEAMGVYTFRHKAAAWSIAAFFLGIAGALFGNMSGFIEPLEVAFPTITFGIFMVAMCLLGGKGTLWGPVVGAILFHVIKETTWTYLLGWQWIALGVIIVVNVVFFQQGIVGWMQEKWPEKFGINVDDRMSAEPANAAASKGGENV